MYRIAVTNKLLLGDFSEEDDYEPTFRDIDFTDIAPEELAAMEEQAGLDSRVY